MIAKKVTHLFPTLFLCAVFIVAAAGFFKSDFSGTHTASALSSPYSPDVPDVHIQSADHFCADQVADNPDTAESHDPNSDDADCLRVRIVNPQDSYGGSDFQFCNYLNGAQGCTPWASDGGGSSPIIVSGNSFVYSAVVVRTRPLPIPTMRFRNVSVGIELFYRSNGSACGYGNGPHFSSNANWSGWSTGASGDDDPGCSRIYLSNTIDINPDAHYENSNIPGTMNDNTAYNGGYNIVMKNKGPSWTSDTVVQNPSGCDPDAHVNDPDPWDCETTMVVSSSRYKLKRIDNAPISVTNLAGDGTMPYYQTINVHYYHEWSQQICEPPGPGDGEDDDIIPILTLQGQKSLWAKLVDKLIPTAHAQAGEQCYGPYSLDYSIESPSRNVNFDDNATFSGINITTGVAGNYVLRFQMFDTATGTFIPSGSGQFPSWTADIPISVVSTFVPLDATITAATPINHNQNTFLTWTSTNANLGCVQYRENTYLAGDWQVISSAPSGSNVPNGPLNGTASGRYYRYLNQCSGNNTTPPTMGAVATVYVNPAPPLSATMTASSPIAHNANTTLNWGSANAVSCTQDREQTYGAGNWVSIASTTGNTLSGSAAYGPLAGPGNYRFRNTCTNPNATPTTTTQIAEVSVNAPPPLSATMTGTSPIAHNTNTTLNWSSTNATACSQYQEIGYNTGNWGTPFSNTLTGTASRGPYAGPGNQRFLNRCTNSSASPATIDAVADVTINAPLPLGAAITATTPISHNTATTVSWSSTNATACTQYEEQTYGAGNWVAFSSTLSGSTTRGPYAGASDHRYLNQCTNPNTSPAIVSPVASTHVNAPLPLDATLSATTPVKVGQSTTLTWGSTNAASCQVYREQTYGAGNWAAISGANTLSGSQSFGPFTAAGNYRFLNQCANPNTSPTSMNSGIVTVVVNNLPTADLQARPDGSGSFSNGPVSVSYNTSADLSWTSADATSCTVTSSPNVGSWSGTSNANQGTPNLTANTTFTISCTGPGSPPNGTDSVTVNVAPPPPGSISVNVSVCAQATITWTAPPSGTVTGYNVYRSTDSTVWQQINTSGPLSSATFSYVDAPPLGNYYYGATALNGASESTRRTAGPANVRACAPNISNSDKDITAVSPVGISTSQTNVQPCNAVSDPVVLNGNKSFKVNDIVTFRINICNSGDLAAQAVQVTDTLSNLSAPGNYSYSGCASGSASVSGSTITFVVGDVAAGSTCSISFTAKVTKPATGTIYRFQNIADIKPTNLPVRRVVTPAYLFTDSTGNPDRNEIAP